MRSGFVTATHLLRWLRCPEISGAGDAHHGNLFSISFRVHSSPQFLLTCSRAKFSRALYPEKEAPGETREINQSTDCYWISVGCIRLVNLSHELARRWSSWKRR